jgi:Uma2 family endonuclease
VEIISEFTQNYDREKKKSLYATYGVGYYWLIDQYDKKIEIFKSTGKGYEIEAVYLGNQEFESPLFPMLKISGVFEGV